MKEAERQLLCSWLHGENTEHLQEFKYFTYFPELFRAVVKAKDKTDILGISKAAGISTPELVKFTNEWLPSTYDGYYRAMKENKIRLMLENALKSKSNFQEQIEAVIKEVDSLQVIRIKEPVDLCEAYRLEIERRKTVLPLKFGLPTLDYLTGGLRNRELTVIAARPSVGKTALALQVAFNLAIKGNSVLFFSLEMSGSQLMERLVCRETKIQHERLKTPSQMGKSDADELENFMGLYAVTMQKYLNIVEGTTNLFEIKRHIEHYRPSVVFIDQLSQIRENRRFNSIREQFTFVTNSLKAITMSLDVPIVLLAQINRDAQNREPALADLKESGSIEEDSDNVIMIHQTDEPKAGWTPVSIIIRKQRNGEKDRAISAHFLNQRFVFQEVAK